MQIMIKVSFILAILIALALGAIKVYRLGYEVGSHAKANELSMVMQENIMTCATRSNAAVADCRRQTFLLKSKNSMLNRKIGSFTENNVCFNRSTYKVDK